ncbi:MAG: hypothetical protein ACKPJD_14910, partial [Planctomycetaceae bacterium]
MTTVEFPEETSLAEKFLIDDRARVRFDQTKISDNICKKVVSQVLGERAQVAKQRTAGIARPGASEFLDLISALVMFAD